MKKDKKFIGHIVTVPEQVKPEFLAKRLKRHPTFVIVEIHSDKQYGAVAQIYQRNSIFDRYQETTTKAQRKKLSDSLAEIGTKKDKPLDTSKWVKPDEETIRNALIESLFALEILKEDSPKYDYYYGKAQAFYSLLHGHSPKNPQMLNDWCIDPHFKKIMEELKAPVVMKWWKDFNKEFKFLGKPKKWTDKQKNDYHDKRRAEYQTWKNKCLKNMIIVDSNPPKFKDIFAECKKELDKRMCTCGHLSKEHHADIKNSKFSMECTKCKCKDFVGVKAKEECETNGSREKDK